MKILFLTVGITNQNNPSGFYDDLIQEMVKDGHEVTAVAPMLPDSIKGVNIEGKVRVLRVQTGKFRGEKSILKKGLIILSLGYKYRRAVKKYLWKEDFDIIFLPTPPSSLADLATKIKKHNNALLYVILRDIHPECFKRDKVLKSVLDNKELYEECKKPYRINPLIYRFMYIKSQKLYRNADYIGCMTPGNIEYVHSIAPKVEKKRIVLLPNWYSDQEKPKSITDLEALKEKYGLKNKFIAIFGGTIGPAQAVWNIATLAKRFINYSDIVFLVVGKGPKKQVLMDMAKNDHLSNLKFLDYMPREEYEAILGLADVGLISIDEKYPVPTSPSKIIGYMAMHKPVLAMFNEGNDYGTFYIDKPGCGLWSAGLDNEKMVSNFYWMYSHPKECKEMGESGYNYYRQHFIITIVYRELLNQLKNV